MQLQGASPTGLVEIQAVSLGEHELDAASVAAMSADGSNRRKVQDKEQDIRSTLQDAEIARIGALGEAEAIPIRAEAEAQGLRSASPSARRHVQLTGAGSHPACGGAGSYEPFPFFFR